MLERQNSRPNSKEFNKATTAEQNGSRKQDNFEKTTEKQILNEGIMLLGLLNLARTDKW